MACPAPIDVRPVSLTHYIIVRSDLPVGFLVAQAVHAAGESSPGDLGSGTNAVVLSAPDQPALEVLRLRLEAAGVEHKAIYEPDPPWLGALTAIGLKPVADRARLRPILSSLPLFGKAPPCEDCAASFKAVGAPCYACNGGLRRAR